MRIENGAKISNIVTQIIYLCNHKTQSQAHGMPTQCRPSSNSIISYPIKQIMDGIVNCLMLHMALNGSTSPIYIAMKFKLVQ